MFVAPPMATTSTPSPTRSRPCRRARARIAFSSLAPSTSTTACTSSRRPSSPMPQFRSGDLARSDAHVADLGTIADCVEHVVDVLESAHVDLHRDATDAVSHCILFVVVDADVLDATVEPVEGAQQRADRAVSPLVLELDRRPLPPEATGPRLRGPQTDQGDDGEHGAADGGEVTAGCCGQPDGSRQPHRGRGGDAEHRRAIAQDGTGADEADAGG